MPAHLRRASGPDREFTEAYQIELMTSNHLNRKDLISRNGFDMPRELSVHEIKPITI